MERFFERINFDGELDAIGLSICEKLSLGDLVSSTLVTTGYEDFNFILETLHGKYFVKGFSNFRTDDDCVRYTDVMVKVGGTGVSTPHLLNGGQGCLFEVTVGDITFRFCLLDHIEGSTYYSLGEKPNENEITEIAYQAALINSIGIIPRPKYDSWAVVNFLIEFNKKGSYLSSGDYNLEEVLVEEFTRIDIKSLPHCFVHGDINSTNVMRDDKGGIWVIDFSSANYYPRIQEIAVLASNLLFDEDLKEKSERNLRIALETYQKRIQLTARELDALPSYIKLAYGMNLLLANFELVAEENHSRENEYWIEQGRIGLLQAA